MGGKGTFGPGTGWNANHMSELDGVWRVDRVGGALPPLIGCRKRIHGNQGTTEFSRVPGMPFEVRGLELHYRPPFRGFVDLLEPDGERYRGTATFRGLEFGRFVMERAP